MMWGAKDLHSMSVPDYARRPRCPRIWPSLHDTTEHGAARRRRISRGRHLHHGRIHHGLCVACTSGQQQDLAAPCCRQPRPQHPHLPLLTGSGAPPPVSTTQSGLGSAVEWGHARLRIELARRRRRRAAARRAYQSRGRRRRGAARVSALLWKTGTGSTRKCEMRMLGQSHTSTWSRGPRLCWAV